MTTASSDRSPANITISLVCLFGQRVISDTLKRKQMLLSVVNVLDRIVFTSDHTQTTDCLYLDTMCLESKTKQNN